MVSQRSPRQRPARKARTITQPRFKKFNTVEKLKAMVEKRDEEVTKMYRVSVTRWKAGAYEGATLPPGLRVCRPIELRAGSAVVAADGITDGQPVHLTVERVIRGRVLGNPVWVVCKGVDDGKVRVIPVVFVGVPVPQAQ